jgi:hypothetical protein
MAAVTGPAPATPGRGRGDRVTGVTDLFLTSRAGRIDHRGTRCTSCLPGAMHQHLAKRRARAIDLTKSKISGRRTGEYVADEHADKTAASEQIIGDLRGLPAVIASPPVTRRHDRGLLSRQAIFRDDRVPRS